MKKLIVCAMVLMNAWGIVWGAGDVCAVFPSIRLNNESIHTFMESPDGFVKTFKKFQTTELILEYDRRQDEWPDDERLYASLKRVLTDAPLESAKITLRTPTCSLLPIIEIIETIKNPCLKNLEFAYTDVEMATIAQSDVTALGIALKGTSLEFLTLQIPATLSRTTQCMKMELPSLGFLEGCLPETFKQFNLHIKNPGDFKEHVGGKIILL